MEGGRVEGRRERKAGAGGGGSSGGMVTMESAVAVGAGVMGGANGKYHSCHGNGRGEWYLLMVLCGANGKCPNELGEGWGAGVTGRA